MIKQTITTLFIAAVSFVTFSQESAYVEPWTFEQCVNYALDNNISVKQQKLNVNYRENQLLQSKYNLAPSVNANVRHNFNFGKSTQSDNTFINQNSQSTNFALNADVVLFNGFAKQNTIKKRQLELEYTIHDLNKIKNDITLAVASAYLQILFNRELVDITKQQIDVTKLQLIDYNKKVDAGSMPKGKLFETEAQLANEELTLTNYENELFLAKLNLIQLLELESIEGFSIVTPQFDESLLDISILKAETVFSKALEYRPEIKSKEIKLKSMEYETKISKAQLMPVLSAYAGYNNFYNNKYMKDTILKMPLSDQLNLNAQTTVGLQLQIPIFNGLSGKTNLKNSKISYQSAKYDLELEKNNLLKEIQQLNADAIAAMKKYYSSKKAVESYEEAFRYIQEKFNLGIVTPLEYNEVKNNLINAGSSFIQSKYEYLFKVKILNYYNGEEIKL